MAHWLGTCSLRLSKLQPQHRCTIIGDQCVLFYIKWLFRQSCLNEKLIITITADFKPPRVYGQQ